MLNTSPVPDSRGYALPSEVLEQLGLAHMSRRRFLSPEQALAWVLTVRW